MTDQETDDLLELHRAALRSYQEWDERVKHLLQGRRVSDLTTEDIEAYREAAEKRDAAYSQMRYYERALLDDIPGASTGKFPRLRRDGKEG